MNLTQNSLRKKAATLLIGAVLLSSTITMGFSTVLGKSVNVIIKGEEKKFITYSATVEDFLKSEKIILKDKEVITPSLNTEIKDDMDIIIQAPKSYQINNGNEIYIAKAVGETVSEVLENLNIKVDSDDVVTPKLNAKASTEKPIVIERVFKESSEVKTEIPFETIKNENASLVVGETKIIKKGKVGVKSEVIQNTFVNDKLVSIDVLKSEILEKPETEIVEIGTKKTAASATLEGKKIKKVITMQATAYDPTAGSLTALGTKARVGAVAVDPKVIPLGSKLYIETMDGWPSYGYAVAEDTGGAIKGNRIDLFFNSNATANDFGRRNVKVYVIE
ncbi:3D domain-containing protein [Peptoniphilus mikwangii]|uniref:3D domain-containing protein n=1 Tax=Peptoniphilus mikwangii TaxID=1354300 RepID=UPI000410D9CD|nr:3D domain-containing protein [Peptoniphilus mikwangii]